MEIQWADAFEMGAEAAMDCAAETENAFIEGTQSHEAWAAGFKSVCLGPVQI